MDTSIGRKKRIRQLGEYYYANNKTARRIKYSLGGYCNDVYEHYAIVSYASQFIVIIVISLYANSQYNDFY